MVQSTTTSTATTSLDPVLFDSNQAYIATYTTVEWAGDIKAYPLDATTGVITATEAAKIWSAKTQLEAQSAGSRVIRYMHPTTKALRSFTYSNLAADGYGGTGGSGVPLHTPWTGRSRLRFTACCQQECGGHQRRDRSPAHHFVPQSVVPRANPQRRSARAAESGFARRGRQ